MLVPKAAICRLLLLLMGLYLGIYYCGLVSKGILAWVVHYQPGASLFFIGDFIRFYNKVHRIERLPNAKLHVVALSHLDFSVFD